MAETALDPDEARALMREFAVVVRPGETLIIRVPSDWRPTVIREYQDALNAGWDEGDPLLPFRTVVVAGEELGVAQPWAWPGGCVPIQPVPIDEPPGGWRPEPRKWRYHVGGTCGRPQADGTCGCGEGTQPDAG